MTQTERLEYLITCLIKEQPANRREKTAVAVIDERSSGCSDQQRISSYTG